MNVLAIYAHPNPQSFNHALLEEFRRGLEEAGHSLEVIDLYAIDFDPCLGGVDLAGYEGAPPPEDVKEQQAKVVAADALAFFFPVWWYAPPAILKGWFDRVFTIRFAFNFGEEGLDGLLKHEKALIFNTTMGPEEFYTQAGFGEAMTKLMVSSIQTCGIQNVEHVFLNNVMGPAEVRKAHLEKVYRMGKEF